MRLDAHQRGRSRGQVIVIFGLALVAMVGMVGLVIDGGAAFAQQRVAQNGSDGASTAGALVVAQKLSGVPRDEGDVWFEIDKVARSNGLTVGTAEYTTDTGVPIGVSVTRDPASTAAIPPTARGVRVAGTRDVGTTFARVFGIQSFTAGADATVVAGALSGQCVAEEEGCVLLPLTFPIKTSECDGRGNLLPGGTWIGAPPPGHETEGYWPLVGQESLPGGTYVNGDPNLESILPLCRGAGDSSGAFGWLDLAAGMNLSQEITGPLDVDINLPDWFQAQSGNPNNVEAELSYYIGKTVLIPLYNGACRSDPGNTAICNDPGAPSGTNTWFYVPILGNFYLDKVYVQGANVNQCARPPGKPLVPVTTGAGFLGCLKGWFVNYVRSGPIVPGEPIVAGSTPIGIQLIK